MYEAADQSWRSQPKVMSPQTAAVVGRRIAAHASENGLELVRVVLHGGEPLLTGVERLREIIDLVRAPLLGLDRPPRLDLRIHTNGVRLDTDYCELFREHSVKVGVSLDGDRSANDRHRRYSNGASSHARVLAALELLRTPRYRHLYAGILCTVDIANDPVDVYRALAAEQPPRIDLLLPHATWDDPPPRPDGIARPSTSADPAYAHWLLEIHRVWENDGRPFGIRLFDSIRSTLHGGPPLTEALGVAPSDVLVIETDGAIEQADSLKVAFDGAPDTGLRVQDHPLSAAAEHAQIIARQSGAEGLSESCRSCPVLASCGAGLFAHRYRKDGFDPDDAAAAFRNPTVYCADLLTLIDTLHTLHTAESAAMSTSDRFTLTDELFAQLASGHGDGVALGSLTESQAGINRAFLAETGRALANQTTEGAAAWELVQAVDQSRPEAVAKAFAHPLFRVWASETLLDPVSARPEVFVGYALAAAAHAGLAASLPVPSGVSSVYLPGLCRIAVEDGAAAVLGGGEPAAPLAEARYLGEGAHAPRVLLEDLDDARDCFQLSPASRLSEAELEVWRATYETAWALIEERHPDYAAALSVGLRALVPLSPSPDGNAASGTARNAFGALGLALPADPEVLALLIIHEFQHVKLGAVLDLFDLYDEADTRLYYAPWRSDPRPLEGLLQGTYAHVAVVDYWRRRALADAGGAAETAAEAEAEAQTHFARWRDQTWQALEQLEESGSLTELGRRFTEGLRTTLSPWREQAVSEHALSAATRESSAHRSAFESATGGRP